MIFVWKNGRFSGRIWPDWGNTAWADMAGLGSIGLHPYSLVVVTRKKAELPSRPIYSTLSGLYIITQAAYSRFSTYRRRPLTCGGGGRGCGCRGR